MTDSTDEAINYIELFIRIMTEEKIGYSVFITMYRQEYEISQKFDKYDNVYILIIPNRGEDTGGFMYAYRYILQEGKFHDYYIKAYSIDNPIYKEYFFNTLIKGIKKVIEYFTTNENAGLYIPVVTYNDYKNMKTTLDIYDIYNRSIFSNNKKLSIDWSDFREKYKLSTFEYPTPLHLVRYKIQFSILNDSLPIYDIDSYKFLLGVDPLETVSQHNSANDEILKSYGIISESDVPKLIYSSFCITKKSIEKIFPTVDFTTRLIQLLEHNSEVDIYVQKYMTAWKNLFLLIPLKYNFTYYYDMVVTGGYGEHTDKKSDILARINELLKEP